MSRADDARKIASLKAENAALKLRLANRVAQIELLLTQIAEAKTALSAAGYELHYSYDDHEPILSSGLDRPA